MCLVERRGARGRGLAYAVAIALCFGPAVEARAQDAPPAAGATIMSSGETVLLRENPGYDAAVLTSLGDGNPIEVTGGEVTAADGTVWLPVASGGQSGFVPAGYVGDAATAVVEPAPETIPETAPETVPAPPPSEETTAPAPAAAPAAGTATITTTDANLRTGPSTDADVLTVLAPGTPLSVDGPAENGFVPVSWEGGAGWVAAELLGNGSAPAAAAAAPAPAPDPNTPFVGTTMGDLELRVAPDWSSAVLNVVPAGSALQTTGGPQNGFFPVSYNGQIGWVPGESLSITGGETTSIAPASVDVTTPAPAAAPAPEETTAQSPEDAQRANRESTGINWPFAGGEWEVVQGYNGATHNNRGGFAQYQYALDWARVDGDTAGQPVFAPVSGTVKWTDRGSGGILIDAGNGYGVALMHVTVEGVSRGDQVERGQRIGRISGPGGDGYMSMAHIEMDAWRLTGNGHESVPFVGPNAIAGQEFPDTGGGNQHMGARVTP